MPTINNNTNILENFIRLIDVQISKYNQYNDNTEIIDRLFQSFAKAFNGLRRLIDADTIKKYNDISRELQKKYDAKKEEVNKLLSEELSPNTTLQTNTEIAEPTTTTEP